MAAATKDPIGQRFLSRLRHRPCYGGLDLGAVADLTAFPLVWPVRNFLYVYPWCWIPEESIAERSRKDNVPYKSWVDAGYMETTPGNVTDWRYVTQRIKDLAGIFDIREISYDRAGARDTAADLNEFGLKVVDMGQGFLSMSPPSKRLESLVLSRHLIHTGHPVMRWCLDCTTVTQDAAGNIKPVKPDRLRSSKRIDIIVALIMAIDSWMKNGGDASYDLIVL